MPTHPPTIAADGQAVFTRPTRTFVSPSEYRGRFAAAPGPWRRGPRGRPVFTYAGAVCGLNPRNFVLVDAGLDGHVEVEEQDKRQRRTGVASRLAGFANEPDELSLATTLICAVAVLVLVHGFATNSTFLDGPHRLSWFCAERRACKLLAASHPLESKREISAALIKKVESRTASQERNDGGCY